jgi:hypothetical protein
MKKAVLWKEDQWGLDILRVIIWGWRVKRGGGDRMRRSRARLEGLKMGRSWRSKSMVEGRDGDLLKI